MKNYKMILYAIETDQGLEHVAEYPALKGVIGVGETQIEAINDLYENAAINIEALEEAGLPIPLEDIIDRNEYSGKLSARLTKSLHRKLAELAVREGVSINQCIVEAVATYVEGKNFEYKIDESLKYDRFVDYYHINVKKLDYPTTGSIVFKKASDFLGKNFYKKEDLNHA